MNNANNNNNDKEKELAGTQAAETVAGSGLGWEEQQDKHTAAFLNLHSRITSVAKIVHYVSRVCVCVDLHPGDNDRVSLHQPCNHGAFTATTGL